MGAYFLCLLASLRFRKPLSIRAVPTMSELTPAPSNNPALELGCEVLYAFITFKLPSTPKVNPGRRRRAPRRTFPASQVRFMLPFTPVAGASVACRGMLPSIMAAAMVMAISFFTMTLLSYNPHITILVSQNSKLEAEVTRVESR